MSVSRFNGKPTDNALQHGHGEWTLGAEFFGITGPEILVARAFLSDGISIEAHTEQGYTYVTLDLYTAANLAADLIDRIHRQR